MKFQNISLENEDNTRYFQYHQLKPKYRILAQFFHKIIRESQCDLIIFFLMNKENDSTNETELNASENYSPGLIVGLVLGS
jgi:hypothetical protein